MKSLPPDPRLEAWRRESRGYLAQSVPPERVFWRSVQQTQRDLFAAPGGDAPDAGKRPRVPKRFAEAIAYVAAFRSDDRWDLLYRLLWRLTHGEPHLMSVAVDPDVIRFVTMQHAVQRDIHKCHAFVRFVQTADGRFVSWYRPQHRVLRLSVPHFVARYPHMAFSIYSQDESVHWDTHNLTLGPGCARHEVPGLEGDTATQALWETYYSAIFNPARLKLKAMRQEMPVRYWSVMPETRLIDRLIREAPSRVEAFHAAQPRSAQEYVPAAPTGLDELRSAARGCATCAFAQQATQTVFGAGEVTARLMVVGEQPGNDEDLQGTPFIGPAGQLLNRALADAGIDRKETYVTNAVKHFKWAPRGKRRLHQRPAAGDVAACKPWLAAEVALVKPEVLLCLGATAAHAAFGKIITLRALEPTWHQTALCRKTWVTPHPASILRQPDELSQKKAYEHLVADLHKIREALS